MSNPLTAAAGLLAAGLLFTPLAAEAAPLGPIAAPPVAETVTPVQYGYGYGGYYGRPRGYGYGGYGYRRRFFGGPRFGYGYARPRFYGPRPFYGRRFGYRPYY